eukprot:g15540.t1
MSLTDMRTSLRGVAAVSSAVRDMLNSLGSFDIMEIAAPGDDPTDPHIPLTERLEILIDAIITITSKGVAGDVSAARVSALQAGLREGYTELRRHSNECRSLMRVRANYANMARLVNKDLNEWAGQLYTQSSIFTGQHLVPPRTSEFPAIVVPTWTWLTQYIRAGGLHNSQHQPPPRASAPRGGGGRSGGTTPSGKVGYCYAWATAGGCSRDERDCKFEHAHDPAKKNARGGGNRNGNRSRGDNNRAGGTAADGSGCDGGSDGDPDACNPNPCENGGTCEIDPAGGHFCTCSSDDYRGMHCQIETAGLAEFEIQVVLEGTWTSSLQAIFQDAADRWADVISRTPCGNGVNTITATLEYIDGVGGTLGFAGPRSLNSGCPTISVSGVMTFDLSDIEIMEANGSLYDVILHEMGHVIGIGTLWNRFGYTCSTCYNDGSDEWTCPALIEEYNDLLGNPDGTEAEVIETGGGQGTACGHLDEAIFDDELMTGYISNFANPLSKLTTASLEDIEYIVNPAAVDPYTLPQFRVDAAAQRGGEDDGYHLVFQSVSVNTTIDLVDENGNVVGETTGIMIETYLP